MWLVKFLLILLIIYEAQSRRVAEEDEPRPAVTISNGIVKGLILKDFTKKHLPYYAFNAIPYAKPPIDKLRFEPPVPAENWQEPLDCAAPGPVCPQDSSPFMSEDCLFINVHTSQFPGTNDSLAPVFVYVGGVGFYSDNSTDNLYIANNLVRQDAVFVRINYRLGIFGFLSTGDKVVPGNNGLKDILLGLQWVKTNIKAFGGDPKLVTLVGSNSGAAAVSYIMQSPKAYSLFHRVIMLSGVSLSSWSYSRHHKDVFRALAKKVNVDHKNTQTVVQSLRAFKTEELLLLANNVSNELYMDFNPREGFVFGPVIEKSNKLSIITEKTYKKLVKGKFNKMPIMVGYNSLDNHFEVGRFSQLRLSRLNIDPIPLYPVGMNVRSLFTKAKASLRIKYRYEKHFKKNGTVGIKKFIYDDQYVRPIQEFVKIVSEHCSTYFYRFNYKGDILKCYNKLHPGVTNDMIYLGLGTHTDNECKPNAADSKKTKQMVKMWMYFAKKGNPTPYPYAKGVLKGIRWRTANSKNNSLLLNYLQIGTKIRVLVNPDRGAIRFWNDLYKRYGRPPYHTY